MLKDIRHGGSFIAVDEGGTEYQLHILSEIIDAGTKDDPDAELEGLKRIQTDDGRLVNHKGKGKYEIVESGEILTSGDPEAP